MISRSSRAQAIVNAALAKKKNSKYKGKTKLKLVDYSERKPWELCNHNKRFVALDRFRRK